MGHNVVWILAIVAGLCWGQRETGVTVCLSETDSMKLFGTSQYCLVANNSINQGLPKTSTKVSEADGVTLSVTNYDRLNNNCYILTHFSNDSVQTNMGFGLVPTFPEVKTVVVKLSCSGETNNIAFNTIQIAYAVCGTSGNNTSFIVEKRCRCCNTSVDFTFYGVLIFVVLVIVFLVLFVILFYCMRHYLRRRKEAEELDDDLSSIVLPPNAVTYTANGQTVIIPDSQSVAKGSGQAESQAGRMHQSVHSLFSMKDLWIDRRRISVGRLVKEGQFGKIYDGHLVNAEDDVEGAIPVVIKTVKESAPESATTALLDGCSVLRHVQHRHLLQVLGMHSSANEPILVLLAKTTFGTLKQFLMDIRLQGGPQSSYGKLLLTQDMVSITAQISRGMYHLYKKGGIVHKDLATRNIFVHENLLVKIGDYGLSWDLFPEDYRLMPDGSHVSVKWAAVEVLEERNYTVYSDVWSFGVVLWETMTMGMTPYEEVPMDDMVSHLKSGQRLPRPSNCPDDMFSIMGQCWALTPVDRPKFNQLTLGLDHFHRKLNSYI